MKPSISHLSWVGCWLACTLPLLPASGLACDLSERRACEQRVASLVSYRTEAIHHAFGDLSVGLQGQMRIKFVGAKDPQHPLPGGAIAYDREHRVLLLSRSFLGARLPNPLKWAASYWPFYEQQDARATFPVVETIDEALWNVYLHEAARARGVAWDAGECRSVHVEQRLPCEMVASAINELVKERRPPIFNENRIDRVWPEDFAGFVERNWRRGQSEYRDVQHYGGLLLIRPLVAEFGVPRALAYVAQTPFRIVDNNLRVSAQRYQEHARDALRIQRVEWTAHADYEPDGNSHDLEQSTAISTAQLSSRH